MPIFSFGGRHGRSPRVVTSLWFCSISHPAHSSSDSSQAQRPLGELSPKSHCHWEKFPRDRRKAEIRLTRLNNLSLIMTNILVLLPALHVHVAVAAPVAQAAFPEVRHSLLATHVRGPLPVPPPQFPALATSKNRVWGTFSRGNDGTQMIGKNICVFKNES